MGKKKVKNFLVKQVLILFVILFFLANTSAQELPNFQDKYVNDFAHLFDGNETSQLRALLINVEQNTTAEVVVVTINTTSPLSPAQYRTELFNFWKIGKEDKDNGLLILYSLTENRIEVETGYGLEGILPDSKLGRMLDDYYVPYRDNGNVSQGIILFTQEVAKVIQANSHEVYSVPKIKNSFYDWLPYLIFIAIIIIMKFLSRKRIKCKKDGLIMKSLGLIGGYYIYKCANGHIHKISKSAYYEAFMGSGGGSSSGFGSSFGGGFGGGMSGGGGVGR